MKGTTRFLTAVIVFAAGIALIVLHNHVNILQGIVTVMGVALVVPGLINVAVAAFSRKAERRADEGGERRAAYVWSLVVSVFAIVLGIAMLIAPDFFAGIISYLFAAILIAAGFYHVMAVSYLARPFVLPFYFYIIPLLLIAAGFIVLLTGVRTLNAVIVLIMGIAMVASSVSTLLEYIGTHPSKSVEAAPQERIEDGGND